MTVTPASAWMERVALITVVVLAGILYFHRLDDVPVYVSTDEAKFAVQAHSLATTGRDMRGNLLPIFVLIVDPLLPAERSVAWWQPVLFYATALSLALLGDHATASLWLAWAYVGLRVVHSLWQATTNVIMVRFGLFFVSSLVLFALAIRAAMLVS